MFAGRFTLGRHLHGPIDSDHRSRIQRAVDGLLGISDHAHLFEPDVSFHRLHLREIE